MMTKTLLILNSLEKPLPEQSKISSGVYKHYKGNHYLVFCVARHTETGEETVVYQSLYGDFRVWSRPIEMFCDNIEYKGIFQPRFKKVADASEAEKFIFPYCDR